MTAAVPIRPARADEAAALGRLIAESFRHLPLTHWLATDEKERVDALAGQFALIVGHGIAHGDVYVAGDGLGVAVWFPPGQVPDIEGYDEKLAEICGPHLSRFVALDEAMHAAHPESPDHAYLALLAVDESGRDQGIGSALLDEHHSRLDSDGVPAYLDASGLPSRRLYLRHGYADHGEPFGPGGMTGFYPMWREPK